MQRETTIAILFLFFVTILALAIAHVVTQYIVVKNRNILCNCQMQNWMDYYQNDKLIDCQWFARNLDIHKNYCAESTEGGYENGS